MEISVRSGEKQFKLSDNLSEQRESVKVFLGNDVFVNLRTVPVSENLYLFLAIVADIVHSKPKHTCMTRIKFNSDSPARNVYSGLCL